MKSRRTRRRSKQLALRLRTWGGRREGAGRKGSGFKGYVPHRRRPELSGREPVSVTLRVVEGLGNLRFSRRFFAVEKALVSGAERGGFRLIEYSVQSNHLHLIVEADDKRALSRGMQGLSIRIARRLNAELGRKGKVFVARYHARVLSSPRQVRHALAYVLLNRRKHQRRPSPRGAVDPCSSGRWFKGFRQIPTPHADGPLPRAKTFLLRSGWRRHHSLISLNEVPGRPP